MQGKFCHFFKLYKLTMFPWWPGGKESACSAGDPGSVPGLGRFPGEGNGNTLVFLPGEFHGQRSLAGQSPWVTKS